MQWTKGAAFRLYLYTTYTCCRLFWLEFLQYYEYTAEWVEGFGQIFISTYFWPIISFRAGNWLHALNGIQYDLPKFFVGDDFYFMGLIGYFYRQYIQCF